MSIQANETEAMAMEKAMRKKEERDRCRESGTSVFIRVRVTDQYNAMDLAMKVLGQHHDENRFFYFPEESAVVFSCKRAADAFIKMANDHKIVVEKVLSPSEISW